MIYEVGARRGSLLNHEPSGWERMDASHLALLWARVRSRTPAGHSSDAPWTVDEACALLRYADGQVRAWASQAAEGVPELYRRGLRAMPSCREFAAFAGGRGKSWWAEVMSEEALWRRADVRTPAPERGPSSAVDAARTAGGQLADSRGQVGEPPTATLADSADSSRTVGGQAADRNRNTPGSPSDHEVHERQEDQAAADAREQQPPPLRVVSEQAAPRGERTGQVPLMRAHGRLAGAGEGSVPVGELGPSVQAVWRAWREAGAKARHPQPESTPATVAAAVERFGEARCLQLVRWVWEAPRAVRSDGRLVGTTRCGELHSPKVRSILAVVWHPDHVEGLLAEAETWHLAIEAHRAAVERSELEQDVERAVGASGLFGVMQRHTSAEGEVDAGAVLRELEHVELASDVDEDRARHAALAAMVRAWAEDGRWSMEVGVDALRRARRGAA